MTDTYVDDLIFALSAEREPLVLEKIVCHLANNEKMEALQTMRSHEHELAASLTEMESNCFDAGRWFDIQAAIKLSRRQVALIDPALDRIK